MSESTAPPSPPSAPTPKLDPERLALRAQPRPVVRLNRRMLVALLGGLAALVLGATFWSLQPRTREHHPDAELYNVDRVTRSEDLERLPKDYAALPAIPKTPPPLLGEPLPGDLGPAILKAQQPGGSMAGGGGIDPAQVKRLAAEEAARSSVFFRETAGRGTSKAATPAPTDPGSPMAAQQPFSATADVPTRTAAGSAAIDPVAMQNRQDQKESFVAKPGDTSTRHSSGLQSPVSPYQVMAGTIIPAALVTGINSDLPGQVIANVTEGVYDTATGRHLLIPQGSRLIGRYDSQVAFGQRRVLLIWTRLVLPDTSSIALDRLPGIDPAGYAGLEDGVDWHWDRLLAGAALSTLLGVGAELAAPDSQSDSNRVEVTVRQSAQETVSQVGQEVTKRHMSIQPTLTIRPGFPMRVMVSKDLVLRPYQPLFFQRGSSQ